MAESARVNGRAALIVTWHSMRPLYLIRLVFILDY
jgi:hypothetical protein